MTEPNDLLARKILAYFDEKAQRPRANDAEET